MSVWDVGKKEYRKDTGYCTLEILKGHVAPDAAKLTQWAAKDVG